MLEASGTSNMNESEDNLYFGGHLVAFLDIMGQSNKLSELKKHEWWNIDENTISSLQNTYGRVLKFRNIFNSFLTKFCKQSVLDAVFQEISDPDELKLWNQFSQERILTKGISDSLIMTLPLLLNIGLAPLKSIYGVLGACGSSMLSSLNYQFTFRGAVEIGPCIFDQKSNEVYGSALNDAVRYEKEADWPRIIVGPALIRYLKDCVKLPTEPMANRINISTAQKCLALIAQDENGDYFVDYLGNGFDELQDLQNTKKIIETAYQYINSQAVRYRDDKKIGQKYIKMKEYFESRL